MPRSLVNLARTFARVCDLPFRTKLSGSGVHLDGEMVRVHNGFTVSSFGVADLAAAIATTRGTFPFGRPLWTDASLRSQERSETLERLASHPCVVSFGASWLLAWRMNLGLFGDESRFKRDCAAVLVAEIRKAIHLAGVAAFDECLTAEIVSSCPRFAAEYRIARQPMTAAVGRARGGGSIPAEGYRQPKAPRALAAEIYAEAVALRAGTMNGRIFEMFVRPVVQAAAGPRATPRLSRVSLAA